MAQKVLDARVKNKCATSKEWEGVPSFIPLKGEIVIYSDLNKMKVGDGMTTLLSLPFITGSDSGIQDVLVNGSSVVSNMVASIDLNEYAKNSDLTTEIGNRENGDAKALADAKAYSDSNYKQVFLRYSSNSDGSEMTEKWQRGQKFIGTYVGHSASESYLDYEWSQFVGDTHCEESSETSVSVELADDSDMSYTNAVSSLTISIPESASHGFYSGVNFKIGSTKPSISFDNNTKMPLKLALRGASIDAYTPTPNTTCQMAFFCDGINVCCFINEM